MEGRAVISALSLWALSALGKEFLLNSLGLFRKLPRQPTHIFPEGQVELQSCRNMKASRMEPASATYMLTTQPFVLGRQEAHAVLMLQWGTSPALVGHQVFCFSLCFFIPLHWPFSEQSVATAMQGSKNEMAKKYFRLQSSLLHFAGGLFFQNEAWLGVLCHTGVIIRRTERNGNSHRQTFFVVVASQWTFFSPSKSSHREKKYSWLTIMGNLFVSD